MISELDLGEAAVIALALNTRGATVILGDLAARRFAHRAGVPVTGTLGVLLDAKRAGRLASVRDAIDLMRQHGAWLSDVVVDRALRIAGE